jgi:hypothetical protein
MPDGAQPSDTSTELISVLLAAAASSSEIFVFAI